MEYTQLPVRESDQKVFVADIHKIYSKIGWKPKVTAENGIRSMVEWVKDSKHKLNHGFRDTYSINRQAKA